MLAKFTKSLSRNAWFPLTCAVMPLSYLPLVAFQNETPGILLPLAATSICMMLAFRSRKGVLLVVLVSIVLTSVALPFTHWIWNANLDSLLMSLVSLAATQCLLGMTWWGVSHSRLGFAPTQRRLTTRVRRQSRQLRAAKELAETSTNRQFESNRRTLLEHLPVHIVQKGLDGRFTFVTQSFCNLVDREYDEIIGRTDADLFPPEASKKFMEDDQRVIRQGTVFDDVEQTQLPDGTHSYMQVRKAPLRSADGAIMGVQGIFWDVTEEHTGRQELKRIEALAHALIHATLDAVLIVDPDGCVLEANPASESILGYTREQVAAHPSIGAIMQTAIEEVGQRVTDPKDQVSYFDRKVPVAKILESATGKRIEARLRRSDGVWFDAEISAHPLSIEGTEGWAMFVRDITRRKKNETELRSAKEVAERANAAKSEFVANVSHELRTPLTGIIGLHELLQRSEIDSRQLNYLQLAQVSASNLLNLIDDLLDFSKIEAGKIDIESVPFSLVDCVEEAAASIAARAQLRGLELIVDLAPTLPLEVLGDPHRIKQILLNLLGNAIKFTEKGDISVRVRTVGDAAVGESQRVRFEIHDNGIGVPLDQREVIFDAFRQADSSTTRRYGGTGLGLTICRDLVAMMNGHIGITDADSPNSDTEQPGSCFFFELPLTVLVPADSEPAATEAGSNHIVLVASPTPWRALLESQIRQFGFEVTRLSSDELAARKPAHLFDAGNNTIVVADYREVNSQHMPTTPVVVRWLLLTPLANAQPTTTPGWLKHADVRWLARPVRRKELLDALTDDNPPLASQGISAVGNAYAADVLLVEDSPISQTVLKDMLESLGHRVSVAGNGAEAIAACGDQQFDLVLMDIQMPEVDGLSATQAIRAREEEYGQHQLILALTAHASAEDRSLCENAGMDGFLVKPITLDALQQAIASATAIPDPQDLRFVDPLEAAHNASHSANLITPSASNQTMQNEDSDRASKNPQPDAESTPAAGPTAEANSALGEGVEALADAPAWPELVALMNGSEGLLRDVLQLIVREIPKLSRNFSEAVEKEDFKEARRAVHTLKSNVRHVGLGQVSEFAEALEHQSRDENLELLQNATDRVHRVAMAVAEWAEQMAKHD